MRYKIFVHIPPMFFQQAAVPWCFQCSPLSRRNQYTFAVLYLHEYSPERCIFFSGTLRTKSFESPGVAGMTLLYICFCKGSAQVNMLLLSFAGILSWHVMCSSSPLMATNTVLSRCIPARGQSTLVQMEKKVMTNLVILIIINRTKSFCVYSVYAISQK